MKILKHKFFNLLPCPTILKYRLFLIFTTHPEIKPSALKNPIFCFGGLRPP
jgi:hypothetical protein